MVQGFMRGGMVQEEGRNSAGVHERPNGAGVQEEGRNGAGVQEEGRNEWGHRGGAITGQLEANYGRASAALGQCIVQPLDSV